MPEKTQKKAMKLNTDDDCKKKKVRCKSLVIQEHGAKYRTTYTKKYMNRKKWEKPDPDHIFSFIPGTITKICVKEGEVVKKGDNLLVMEAMKMLNIIEIPRDSTIKKIHVKNGDKIPKGYLLVEVE